MQFRVQPAGLLGAAVSLGSFVAYWLTLLPGLGGGDSAELAIAVQYVGLAHPTGTPAYLLLAKLWTWLLPFGELAWRLNVFSAVTASATVLVIFLLVLRLTRSAPSAAISALSVAFAYRFWLLTSSVQPYSLALLCFALALYLVLRYDAAPGAARLYQLAVVSAIGVGTHVIFWLILPVVALYVWWNRRTHTVSSLIRAAALFILGVLALYTYIPLRAYANPVLGWNHPDTVPKILDYLGQKDYAYKVGKFDIGTIFPRLEFALATLLRETLGLGLLLGGAGLALVARRQKKLFWASLVLLACDVVLLLGYGNTQDRVVLYRYLLPGVLLFAVLGGLTLARIGQRSRIGLIACVLLPLVMLGSNWQASNMRNVHIIDDFSANLLRSLPPNAVLLSRGDLITAPLWYRQLILHERQDVIVIDSLLVPVEWYSQDLTEKYPKIIPAELVATDYRQRLAVLITALAERQPLFVFGSTPLPDGYIAVPHGLVQQVQNKDSEVAMAALEQTNTQLWQEYQVRISKKNWQAIDPLVAQLINAYGKTLVNLGVFYAQFGENQAAAQAFERSLEFTPDNSDVRKNLFDYYTAIGEAQKAKKITQ